MSHATALGSSPSGNTTSIGCTGCPRRLILPAIPASFQRTSRFTRRVDLRFRVTPSLLLERRTPGAFLECFEMLRVLLIKFLMVRIGRIKFRRWKNFSHDRFLELSRAGEFFF